MVATPGPAVVSTLRLRFGTAELLADAVRGYSGRMGLGGLCIRVERSYAPGDRVQLEIQIGDGSVGWPLRAVVAWVRPGYIGARFEPSNAAESRTLAYLRHVIGEHTPVVQRGPSLADGTKPFSE